MAGKRGFKRWRLRRHRDSVAELIEAFQESAMWSTAVAAVVILMESLPSGMQERLVELYRLSRASGTAMNG